jgi:integrase
MSSRRVVSSRSTYAIRALRAGSHVAAVRKLLGHASIATTSRYLDHLELDEPRAAVPPLPTLA